MSKARLIATIVALIALCGGMSLVAEKSNMPSSADDVMNEILAVKAGGAALTEEQGRRLEGLYRHYVYLSTGQHYPTQMNTPEATGGEDCATAPTYTAAFTDSDSTAGANDDMGQVNACLSGDGPFVGTGVGPDLVYEFVPPSNGYFEVSMTDTAGDDLNLRILDDSLVAGDPCLDQDGSCLNIADFYFGGATEIAEANVIGGTSYFVVVDGYGGQSGPYDLSATFALPPTNDLCANSLPISCDTPISGSNLFASQDGVGVCGSFGEGNSTVWYTFTAPGDGPVTVDTCGAGTDFDTQLDVFTGSCGALGCVGGNDDSCGLQSEVTFDVTNQTQYQIMVHGFGSSAGNFDLNIDCTDPDFVFARSIIEIPTLNTWGLGLLVSFLMAASLALIYFRRRRA